MTEQAVARTPGARRAGEGEFFFELAEVNPIQGGPNYSSVFGPCVEGERMIIALMRMPAGTGAEPHFHPNEQWIFVLEGTAEAVVGGEPKRVAPGTAIYIPANTVHQMHAAPGADVLFFTCKDASHSLHGMKAAAE